MPKENLRGEFPIIIDGREYETKCNFEVIERLERRILNKSIFEALHSAMNGNIMFSEVVDVIHTAMKSANDVRLTRDKLGNLLHKDGFQNYVEWYITFLTYALTGETESETELVEQGELEKKS